MVTVTSGTVKMNKNFHCAPHFERWLVHCVELFRICAAVHCQHNIFVCFSCLIQCPRIRFVSYEPWGMISKDGFNAINESCSWRASLQEVPSWRCHWIKRLKLRFDWCCPEQSRTVGCAITLWWHRCHPGSVAFQGKWFRFGRNKQGLGRGIAEGYDSWSETRNWSWFGIDHM